MNAELRTGVYNLLQNVEGLSASNVYYSEAPTDQDMPYCTFLGVVNFPNYSSKSVQNPNDIQFNFYGKSVSDVDPITSSFITTFAHKADQLTVDGYTAVTIRPISDRGPNKVNGIWQHIFEYRFLTDKAR